MTTQYVTVTQLRRTSGMPLFRSESTLQEGEIVRTEKSPCPVMRTPRFDFWRILHADEAGAGLYRGEACSEPRAVAEAPARVAAAPAPKAASKRHPRMCMDCGGIDELRCECVS